MQIKVNGETREFRSPLTVQALADALALKPKQMAVGKNCEIVPRSAYGDTSVNEGDEIEIVHFIGGG